MFWEKKEKEDNQIKLRNLYAGQEATVRTRHVETKGEERKWRNHNKTTQKYKGS